MRRLLQHFVLSKTPTLPAPAYDAVNATLNLVYASLTVAHDLVGLEVGPVEGGLSNDTFADQKRQLCALVESLRCGSEGKLEVGVLYLLLRTEAGRST